MSFEIGKCYRHTTGHEIKIVGLLNTTMYGVTLMAECVGTREEFMPVGSDESATQNYIEISNEEWMKNFS